MSRTIFISDLHLSSAHPEITHLFLALLRQCQMGCDALYILGDLFDFWIGDDACKNQVMIQNLMQALAALTRRGIPVYFLHGNRDFLINSVFLKETGCVVLPEEACIDVYGTRVLLMHGDTLCTEDHSYQRLRKVLRSAAFKRIFLSLPVSIRLGLAQCLRAFSQWYTHKKASYRMDVSLQAVFVCASRHAVNTLIHGHTHMPCRHQHVHAQSTLTRFVLGAWHEHAECLIWTAGGEQQLLSAKEM